MFIRNVSATYWWPVKHLIAVDGGKYDTVTFDIQFKRLSDSKLKAILKDENQSDQDFCRENVVGWKSIFDAEKKEIPFSAEELEKLIEEQGVANSIANAWLESVRGAKPKN